jgi:hypothetical protein
LTRLEDLIDRRVSRRLYPDIMDPRAAELIEKLQLRPHPEGGFYREVFRSQVFIAPEDSRGRRTALTTQRSTFCSPRTP